MLKFDKCFTLHSLLRHSDNYSHNIKIMAKVFLSFAVHAVDDPCHSGVLDKGSGRATDGSASKKDTGQTKIEPPKWHDEGLTPRRRGKPETSNCDS